MLVSARQPVEAAPEQALGDAAAALPDTRILIVGDRLATANADLCPAKAPVSGMVIHDIAQYDPADRDAAARMFHVGQEPAVLTVDPNGAAASAGIRPNDTLLRIDGTPLESVVPGPQRSFAPIERAMDRIDEALADGEAEIALRRGAETMTVRLRAPAGCRGRFQLVPGDTFRAAADARYVQISAPLVAYAQTDDELAAILAHELAHIILEHGRRLKAAGVSRGMFESVGRNARLIRITEIEADRLSIYLLDRAGYDVAAPARFWQRYGPKRDLGIFASSTHPGWRKRVAALNEEAAQLARLKQADPRPVPPILQGPLPALD